MGSEVQFGVAVDDVDIAVAWVAERGFAPCRVERLDEEAALVFAPLPEAQMAALVMALPVHLSRKVGIVVGDRTPFSERS